MGDKSDSNNNTIKACVAMLSIAILEGFALSQGIDGVALSAAVAAIAGIGGFVVGKAI